MLPGIELDSEKRVYPTCAQIKEGMADKQLAIDVRNMLRHVDGDEYSIQPGPVEVLEIEQDMAISWPAVI